MAYVPAEDAESSGREAECADRLFRIFHRFPPWRVMRASHSRRIPSVLVDLGRLRGLIYASDRGCRGVPRTYIHFMRSRPRLTCDTGGRQLFIIGGRYRVTRKGIEG